MRIEATYRDKIIQNKKFKVYKLHNFIVSLIAPYNLTSKIKMISLYKRAL